MSDNILDQIDAAITDRCAHCGKPLRPDEPSAWWCNEGCQENWQSGRTAHLQDVVTEITATTPTVGDAVEALRALSDHIADRLDRAPVPVPDLVGQRRGHVLFCPTIADPLHPTASELAAAVRAGVPSHYLADAIAKATTDAAPAGRLARAWHRIRTTLGGTR